MADLIKKVKVMQTDGTFTDYIPLGAEATNVKTEDGMSVENKLKKKPYYFNTVAEMKAATYLKTGDMVVTLGYYENNDGGKSEYIITNSISSNMWQETLNNNLYATLQLNDRELYAEQIGIKTGTDNNNTDSTPLLQNLFALGSFKVIFGRGNYYFSECLIAGGVGGMPTSRGSRVFLQGQTLNHERWTTFKPYNENQRFILKFGGKSDFTIGSNERDQYSIWSVRVEGISFDDSNHPIISPDESNPLKHGLLCLDQVYGFQSKSLDFYNCYGQCCYIRDSWEVYFDCVNARNLLNMNSDYSIFYFDQNTSSSNYNNNSNFVCRHIDTEGIRCHIYSAKGNFTNHYIGNIIIESTGGDTIFDIDNNYLSIIESIRTDYIRNPFIYLRDGAVGNLTIDTINTDSFCDGYSEINGQKYMMSLIKGDAFWGSCHIKEVHTIRKSLLFIENDLTNAGSSYGKFARSDIVIDNIIHSAGYITGDGKYLGQSYFTNFIGNNYNNGCVNINIKCSNGIENPDLIHLLQHKSYIEEDLFKLFYPVSTYCIRAMDSHYSRNFSNYFLKATTSSKVMSLKLDLGDNINKMTIHGKAGWKSSTPAAGVLLLCNFYDDNNEIVGTLTPASHSRASQANFDEEFDFSTISYPYSYFRIVPNTDNLTACISCIECE